MLFQSGKYQEYTEFHADMLLVKANCLKYNPPGHEIHQVCSRVDIAVLKPTVIQRYSVIQIRGFLVNVVLFYPGLNFMSLKERKIKFEPC